MSPAIHVCDHRIETEQGTLFAREWRAGSARAPILLFHDSLGCVDLWRDFPGALASGTGRDVVAYDRLGFGRSDPHPGNIETDFIRAESRLGVPAVLAHLGLKAFIPFGHSVGGGMAAACASAFPHLCRALVTISGQAMIEDRTREGLRNARAFFAEPEQFERLTNYHGAKARWVLDAWLETWVSPTFEGWTLDREVDEIDCPLLAIHGDRDEFGTDAQPKRIASLNVGPSEILMLSGCEHVPHREQPEAVIEAVRQFLSTFDA